MKKFKRAMSLLMSVVIIISAFAGLSVAVNAATVTTYKIQYGASGATYITLTPQLETNTIRYTADGSKPNEASTIYTKRLKTSTACVFRAVEFNINGEKVSSIRITLEPKVRALDFEVQDMKSGSKFVTITTPTEDAVIHFTTDGTKPDENSPVLDGSLVISQSCKIYAVAYKDGYKRSSIKSLTISVNTFLEESSSRDDEDIANSDKDDEIGSGLGSTSSTSGDAIPGTTDKYGLPIISLSDNYVIEGYVNDMALLLNKARGTANTLKSISIDRTLCQISLRRAYEFKFNYVTYRPDGTIWNSALEAYKYSYISGCQFFGSGFKSANAFFESLIKDSTNKARLVNPDYDRFGLVNVTINNDVIWMMILVNTK